MGGFASGLVDAASAATKEFAEHIGAVSHIFKDTPEGTMLHNDALNIFQPVKMQLKENLLKTRVEAAKIDPAKPPVNIGEISSESNKGARHAWLGPKDALGVTLVSSVEKKYGLAKAQSLSNAIAFVLKDHVDPNNPSTVQGAIAAGRKGGGTPYSSFKENVRQAGIPLDTTPTFTPAGKKERAVTSAIYQTFAPLMVVPHIATIANGLFGSTPSQFLEGTTKAATKILGSGMDDFHALVNTGALTEHYMAVVKDWNLMQATGHPEIMNNPVAKIVYKTFHQPGFTAWRDYNLLSGANIGKLVSEQLGRDLHSQGITPRLQWQAIQLGLDPQKLISNKGNLDQDDLARGIFKFVNDVYFLDNSLSRSTLLQGTPLGRVLGTFHGYVTRQSKLMLKSTSLDLNKYGPARIATNYAVLSTLMPLMGEGIKLLQETYRGQDAGGDLKEDVENIQGKHGFMPAAETYLGAYAHVGTYGIFGHVIRGSLTHSLLQTATGPIGSASANLLQDTAGAIKKDFTDHPRDITKRNPRTQKHWAPVEKDLMYDIPGVSLLAQFLSHRILPNAKDNPRHDPIRKLYHHMRGEDSYGNPIEEPSNENKK